MIRARNEYMVVVREPMSVGIYTYLYIQTVHRNKRAHKHTGRDRDTDAVSLYLCIWNWTLYIGVLLIHKVDLCVRGVHCTSCKYSYTHIRTHAHIHTYKTFSTHTHIYKAYRISHHTHTHTLALIIISGSSVHFHVMYFTMPNIIQFECVLSTRNVGRNREQYFAIDDNTLIRLCHHQLTGFTTLWKSPWAMCVRVSLCFLSLLQTSLSLSNSPLKFHVSHLLVSLSSIYSSSPHNKCCKLKMNTKQTMFNCISRFKKNNKK